MGEIFFHYCMVKISEHERYECQSYKDGSSADLRGRCYQYDAMQLVELASFIGDFLVVSFILPAPFKDGSRDTVAFGTLRDSISRVFNM